MKKRFNNLPKSFGPDFQYATTVKTGNLLFVSGNGPGLKDDNTPFSGSQTYQYQNKMLLRHHIL